MIWTRTRHTNALRSALREYYPPALAAFEDLAHGDALGLLGRASTPAEGAHLRLSAIQSALKRGGLATQYGIGRPEFLVRKAACLTTASNWKCTWNQAVRFGA